MIRRPDRLDAIAKHIVSHFPRRGYLGKAVVISLDKFTAVRMFDRVERLWKEEIKHLTGQAAVRLLHQRKLKQNVRRHRRAVARA